MEINIFISQPMSSLSKEEIILTRNHAIKRIMSFFDNKHPLYFINNLDFTEGKLPLEYLGKDIELLAKADRVYIVDSYFNRKIQGKISYGCEAEITIARMYGYPIYNMNNILINDELEMLPSSKFKKFYNIEDYETSN